MAQEFLSNRPVLKEALLDYIRDNGIVNSLDLHTTAKEEFLLALNEVVLQPRGLEYRTQFCGPTVTNAVEAALKLGQKVHQTTECRCIHEFLPYRMR